MVHIIFLFIQINLSLFSGVLMSFTKWYVLNYDKMFTKFISFVKDLESWELGMFIVANM